MVLKILEDKHVLEKDVLKFGPSMAFLNHEWVSVVAFLALASSLFYFARKPLKP